MAAKGLDLSSLRVISDEEVAALGVFGPDEPDGEPGPGYVYFIEEGDGQGGATGYYKVGSSKDPARRMQDLQTGNPRPLGILYYWRVNNMTNAERAAHSAVAGYAATLGGGTEWYAVAANQLTAFITAITNAVAGLTLSSV